MCVLLCLLAAGHATSARKQSPVRGKAASARPVRKSVAQAPVSGAAKGSTGTATRTTRRAATPRTAAKARTATATVARRAPARSASVRTVSARTASATSRTRRARLRRVKWNPVFPGSHAMLVRQNEQLNDLELPRIANDDELITLEMANELVPVADSESLTVAPNLLESRRYCRPWTRSFLQDMSAAFYDEFRHPIVATSLVRTVEQQKKLRRRIRNAGPPDGETASTHLTGVTVDILKRGLTKEEHTWIEQYMMPLKQAGLVDPIEERRQPVFHVVVFNTYDTVFHPAPAEADPQAPIPQPIPTFTNPVAPVTVTLEDLPVGLTPTGSN